MTYQATWTNGTSGRVTAAVDYICLSDVQEIADAINRRRQLLYQSAQDYSSVIKTGALVGRSVLSLAMAPPFDNFCSAVTGPLLNPTCGTLGGQPAIRTAGKTSLWGRFWQRKWSTNWRTVAVLVPC